MCSSPPFPTVFCRETLLFHRENPLLMISHQKERNRNRSHRFINRGRSIRDIQRQVSQEKREQYLTRRYSNTKTVSRIIRAYKNLTKLYNGVGTDGKVNHVMRYGLPSKSEQYIIYEYDRLSSFIKRHSNDKPNSTTRRLSTKLSRMVYNIKPRVAVSKEKMYNLNVPRSMVEEKPLYNGERIHISLKEVL